ncbi:glycosyltransferase [Actinoplanes sp. NPDC051633]|uniref:glycosyltransferase n=1 Tax=Actinoplanes sp. NPDC051633 TaxID=3155670 RepID=UPI0034439359
MSSRIRSVTRRGWRVVGSGRRTPGRPHAYYLAIGFPPAAKSCAYRMRETANQLYAHGWDVTVVTIRQESWEREFGLDHTLSDAVHPAVRIVELPLARTDIETDIRQYSDERSRDPQGWIKESRAKDLEVFPEMVFGSWRPVLEEAMLWLHRHDPADLLVTTCVPYVNIAATLRLWDEAKVPYAVDFRDGWSIDVVGGGEAFTKDSEAGRWESRLMANATKFWLVNEPIAQHYRDRYPDMADKIEVVRNGFDTDSVPSVARTPDPEGGLTFGYLGSVNFKPDHLAAMLDAWRLARKTDPLVARSRLDIRGHIGAGSAREDTAHMELLRAAAADGVTFGGPVAKAKVAETYGSWDVLVLMLVGGRFVTSGKVYEVLSSGMPVLSVHSRDHDASNVLEGSPLWTGAVGLEVEPLAENICRAARMAVEATDEQRAEARRLGARFERTAQVDPAVARLTAAVLGQPSASKENAA